MPVFGLDRRSFGNDIPGQMVGIGGSTYAVFNPKTAGARGHQVTVCHLHVVRRIVVWRERTDVKEMVLLKEVRVGAPLPAAIIAAMTVAMRGYE